LTDVPLDLDSRAHRALYHFSPLKHRYELVADEFVNVTSMLLDNC
jgi:hypothetical protein